MSKRAMSLYAWPQDWQELMLVRPRALVAIDPYHLPPHPCASVYFLWRPWVPGTMRDLEPVDWFNRARAEWEMKGRRHFDGIQFLNEPNLEEESGYPRGSYEAALAAVEWGGRLIPFLRYAWPKAEVHTPPLSPNVTGYLAFWSWMEDLVQQCDRLNVHDYFHIPHLYRGVWDAYRDHFDDLVISECGREGWGTAEYGREILAYWDALDDYVAWAAPFIWNTPQGVWDAWRLQGTEAARVLAGE